MPTVPESLGQVPESLGQVPDFLHMSRKVLKNCFSSDCPAIASIFPKLSRNFYRCGHATHKLRSRYWLLNTSWELLTMDNSLVQVIRASRGKYLKACPHYTVKPVPPDSGVGSARPHWKRVSGSAWNYQTSRLQAASEWLRDLAIDQFMFLWFFNRCALIRVTSPLSEAGRKHKCHADLVEQHVIRQLISARAYTKPVRFSASVDARKRLKPASTEDGYKPFCSVDRPSHIEMTTLWLGKLVNLVTTLSRPCHEVVTTLSQACHKVVTR